MPTTEVPISRRARIHDVVGHAEVNVNRLDTSTYDKHPHTSRSPIRGTGLRNPEAK